MKDSDWFSMMAGFFVLGVLVIGAVGIIEELPSVQSAPRSSTTDFLYLTIAFNPAGGYDQYFPANFSVPADTLIVFSITNYDNGSNPVPNVVRSVSGTVGDTETVTQGSPPTSSTLTSLPTADLAHTFSIPQLGLNAPIPSALSTASPTVTTFEVYFNQTGTFMWMCEAPCDPVSMMMPGFMSGMVSVE